MKTALQLGLTVAVLTVATYGCAYLIASRETGTPVGPPVRPPVRLEPEPPFVRVFDHVVLVVQAGRSGYVEREDIRAAKTRLALSEVIHQSLKREGMPNPQRTVDSVAEQLVQKMNLDLH